MDDLFMQMKGLDVRRVTPPTTTKTRIDFRLRSRSQLFPTIIPKSLTISQLKVIFQYHKTVKLFGTYGMKMYLGHYRMLRNGPLHRVCLRRKPRQQPTGTIFSISLFLVLFNQIKGKTQYNNRKGPAKT